MITDKECSNHEKCIICPLNNICDRELKDTGEYI